MHQSSFQLMHKFAQLVRARPAGATTRILDVGSMGVNGTYRELFLFPGAAYVGLDLAPGPNVDVVPKDPYEWTELPDDSFDVVISGQALEHVEYPWLTLDQIGWKLKPGGLCCLIVPSKGPEHRYPVDCYRYYPDGLRALAKWSGLTVVSLDILRGPTGFTDSSDEWGDCCCVLTKEADAGAATRPPRSRPAQALAPAGHANSPLRLAAAAPAAPLARGDALRAVRSLPVQPRRVLELGPAVAGPLPETAQLLEAEHHVAREALAPGDAALAPAGFDLVLALGFLERLEDPWDALAHIATLLRPGGHLVAAIPNVQNIALLVGLAGGSFGYGLGGHVDPAQLRFFTLRSIEDLITGAGLRIVSTTATLQPSVDVAQFKPAGNVFSHGNLTLSDLSREDMVRLFVHTYVLVAQRPA